MDGRAESELPSSSQPTTTSTCEALQSHIPSHTLHNHQITPRHPKCGPSQLSLLSSCPSSSHRPSAIPSPLTTLWAKRFRFATPATTTMMTTKSTTRKTRIPTRRRRTATTIKTNTKTTKRSSRTSATAAVTTGSGRRSAKTTKTSMMSIRKSTTTSATECTLRAAKIDFPSGIIGTTQQHVGGALVFNSEFMLLVEELVTVYP
ncbi:hypothetical protein IWZ01DRAFT_181596 [Phyllosticta capitalensis]